jgi:hypothetical protein
MSGNDYGLILSIAVAAIFLAVVAALILWLRK